MDAVEVLVMNQGTEFGADFQHSAPIQGDLACGD